METESKQSAQITAKAENGGLIDTFARSISYLRISLTDHCNLRCLYCTPSQECTKLQHDELLRYEEILRVVRLAVAMGIRKVRLTGGEPLVRRGVLEFIEELAQVPGLEDIRLTTNGVLLGQYAERLKAAGIRKLNISLDTLHKERFAEITGVDVFAKVWSGIEQALELGFRPVKLNVVALKGFNDDEFIDFARLTLSQPLQVRFIEFMPIGKESIWDRGKYISSDDIKKLLAPLGDLIPVQAGSMEGPARVFRLPEAVGSVGFISPISHHFCDRCNRLRLTSEGKLRSCLLSDQETDLKGAIRNGATDEDIRNLLKETILNKPKGHKLTEEEAVNCHGSMSRIGG